MTGCSAIANDVELSAMRWILLALSAICLAAGTTQPATKPSVAGGMEFVSPMGWQKVDQDGTTIYVAPDAKEGDSIAIVVWPAKHFDGEFKAAFEAARKEAAGGFMPFRSGDVKSFKSERGDECLSVQEVLQDNAGRRSLRTYMATRHGDRMEVCMFVADTLDGFTRHAKDADAFMGSIHFAAATQPATVRVAK